MKHLNEKNNEEKAHDNTVLEWNGKVIKSLTDLRENYTPELLLKAHLKEDLYYWLLQHYYESEAVQVNDISINDTECLKKLCDILSIKEKESPENEALLKEKREKLSKLTDDENILKEADHAAFDQEELAEMINMDCKKIYLCSSTFNIPLSKPGITYISVGNAALERAFTEQQYQKANIKLQGFILPDTVSIAMQEEAHTAAINNGYDDFADKHTALAIHFHKKLPIIERYIGQCSVNDDFCFRTKFYNKKSEAVKDRDKYVEKAHKEAGQYFDITSSKCIARDTADYYESFINKAFPSEAMERLCSLSRLTVKDNAYRKLKDLVINSKKNLRELFENEITESADYYSMYDINYFREQVDIEEHDYRISESGIGKLLERAVTDNVQYTIENLFNCIKEINNDLNSHISTFLKATFSAFKSYVEEIMKCVDEIGKDLPAEDPNQPDYLEKVILAISTGKK